MADGKVVYDIIGDNSQFQTDVNETEKISQKGFANIRSFGETAFKAIGVASAAALASATAAIGAAVKGASEMASYGDNIDKMSQKLGMSTEAYQEWDAILQHSGASIDSMQASMKTLATAAETGNDAFTKLGLSQAEIANMSQEELFGATITALQNVESETERTYLAGQLLGRGATELGALLNTSAEDTEAMRQRVHELGGVMSEDAVKASAQFKDNLQDLQTAVDGVKRGVVGGFLPALSDIMAGFTSLVAGEEDASTQIESGIEAFIEEFTHVGEKVGEIAGTIVPAIVDAIIEQLPSIVQMGADTILTLALGIADTIPQLIPTIVAVMFTIVDTLIDNVDTLIDAAIAIIVALANGIIDALPRLIAKAPQVVVALATALIQNAPKLLKAGAEIIKQLIKAISDMVGDFIKVGENLLDGLKQGVKNKALALANSVKDAVKGAWEGAKKFLGINSPSKLFMEVGEYVDMGFAKGVSDSADIPRRSISDMLAGITSVTVPTMPVTATAAAAPAVVNTETVSSGANNSRNTVVLQVGRTTFGQVVYDSNNQQDTVHGINYVSRR